MDLLRRAYNYDKQHINLPPPLIRIERKLTLQVLTAPQNNSKL